MVTVNYFSRPMAVQNHLENGGCGCGIVNKSYFISFVFLYFDVVDALW